MKTYKKVLVVCDNVARNSEIKKLIPKEYQAVFAGSKEEAFLTSKDREESILAIIISAAMKDAKFEELTREITGRDSFKSIPVIVMFEESNVKEEILAIKAGAKDVIVMPSEAELFSTRLENVIARGERQETKKVRYLAEHDPLTGIYNKSRFLQEAKTMISENPKKTFVFLYFDILKFQLVNFYYGEDEGNKVIKYISDYLLRLQNIGALLRFGRAESAVFYVCAEYVNEKLMDVMTDLKKRLENFSMEYDLEPRVGMYIIEDSKMDMESILNRAILAYETRKEENGSFYSLYTEELDETIKKEQQILGEMQKALENKEFQLYLQPKYNIHTGRISGAEALVRWDHPTKGLIYPSEFIPVFERNGFITKLDYYMWENACILLRKWLDEGLNPQPISVNVSRVNMYSSRVVQSLIDLVKKYKLSPTLLELEITESAYAENPESLIKLANRLRDYGFTILMDDFGSGYSSLSILKDIEVDILKIDLKFLSSTGNTGRGENIIASIIRMAKWLKIPVIIEGVETENQISFLKTVGGDFVQGFYYAKPMKEEAYRALVSKDEIFKSKNIVKAKDDFDVDAIFQSNPHMKVLFGDMVKALAIFEFDGKNIEFVRVNEGYLDLFGADDPGIKTGNPINYIDEKYRKIVLDRFSELVNSREKTECVYRRRKSDGTYLWINLKLRYIRNIGSSHLILGLAEDVTNQREIDSELRKYRQAVKTSNNSEMKMLVVDDLAPNRAILNKIFQNQYEIVEAKDGVEALEIIKENPEFAIILLDITMPRMNGLEFMKRKNRDPEIADIPVVVITAEDNYEEQMSALELGTNDYILKPFVPDVVRKRISNVMDSIRFTSEMMKRYEEE